MQQFNQTPQPQPSPYPQPQPMYPSQTQPPMQPASNPQANELPFYAQQPQQAQQPMPPMQPTPYPPQAWPQQPMPTPYPSQPPQAWPPQQQQQMWPQQQQQMPYPQMPMQSSAVNVSVNVGGSKGSGLLVRALYFCFIGWWAGWFWLNLGFFFCGLIITLPLGLTMLNRLPTVLTLRPRSQTTSTNVSVATTTMTGMPGTPMMAQTVNVNVNVQGARQHSFLIRALYFIFIGYWVGYIWANIGYMLCVFIFTLPPGIMMLNRLPAVLTLRKN